MDRKSFLLTAGRLGLACCGASALGARAAFGQTQAPAASTDARVEWAKIWTKRFFDIIDRQLDEPTRRRLMEEQGKTCYLGSKEKPQIAKPLTVDQLVAGMNKNAGETCIRREGNSLYFNYVKNSKGLRVSDGYCLCPLVEDGPRELSRTFCYCSVGYVREAFSMMLGTPVKVELLESLRGGGKNCRFRIDLPA